MAPRIQIRPAEEELAARTCLLGGDHALRSETTQAVAMDAEVLGCARRVQPLIRSIAAWFREESGDLRRHQIRQLPEQLVENPIARRSDGVRAVGDRQTVIESAERSRPAPASQSRTLALSGPPQ
jgi:hypothetical protein